MNDFTTLKACFTLILRPFVCAILSRATELETVRQIADSFASNHTERNAAVSVCTIISRHMQGYHKMVKQNLQDCRKTKRYVVRLPHCSSAVIVGFSAVVVRFLVILAAALR